MMMIKFSQNNGNVVVENRSRNVIVFPIIRHDKKTESTETPPTKAIDKIKKFNQPDIIIISNEIQEKQMKKRQRKSLRRQNQFFA